MVAPATSIGQAPTDESQSLPKHAVERIGQHGDPSHSNGVYRLEYSNNGKYLAIRSRENVISIYDVQAKKRLCEFEGHRKLVNTISFSADSTSLVTAAGASEKIKIWNSQTGDLISQIDTVGNAAYFSRSGDQIHVLGRVAVETYSWPGVKLQQKRRWRTSGSGVPVAMSRDGQIVVTQKRAKANVFFTEVINLDEQKRTLLQGPTDMPSTVVISPNQFMLAASYNRDKKVYLWDLRDPARRKFTLDQHQRRVQSICFSQDNRFLVSAAWDGQVIAWDVLSRQSIGTFTGHSERVNATAFSPIGFQFASGASGKSDVSTIIWGLKPKLIPAVDQPQPHQFQRVWNRLGASTLSNALQAVGQVVAGDDALFAFLEQQVEKAIQNGTQISTRRAIDQLDDSDWEVRERATRALMENLAEAETRLRTVLEEGCSPETKFRILRILKHKAKRKIGNLAQQRRWHRIVLALEVISSPRSQALLTKIARGYPNIKIATDARDALKRIEQTSAD